ncbi:hypothetical protein HYN69_17925 (plasmid) [Gemmobacter aquarius]|uniref:Uncharacterized protein n=1 Tax=Paragemmobacter aquarius TaxID=2169400 RepID=A0A2S0URR8_9RHOB|nr:hypothetical protein [Gemmobacter aquarius]AWB50493.1 hypothetical protein HYN69_17925 [Gemmobacter aquarius]
MIAYHSPAGATLRTFAPSRPALAALWFAALADDEADWATWAKAHLAPLHAHEAVVVALNLLQAAHDGDLVRTRQLRTVLASFPENTGSCRITLAARAIAASVE